MDIQEELLFIHRGLITWTILWFFISFFLTNYLVQTPSGSCIYLFFISVLEKYDLETRREFHAVKKGNSPQGLFDFSEDYFA